MSRIENLTEAGELRAAAFDDRMLRDHCQSMAERGAWENWPREHLKLCLGWRDAFERAAAARVAMAEMIESDAAHAAREFGAPRPSDLDSVTP